MRPLDWVSLLTRQRVDYVDRGANVKRGEINIRCPWCGAADPSHHLGINLETGWYACWRNKREHSGKSPLRLLMRLLGVGYGRARELAGLGDDYVDPEGFDAVAARLMGRIREGLAPVRPPRLEMDRRWLPITDDSVMTRRWWNYVYGRGFDADDVSALCATYDLRAARDGEFAMRLIIPYVVDGRLVTWTGRAIAPSAVRYRDLGVEESLVPVKETLFNHDATLDGGSVLAIVEGPLDALKLDFYGREFGVRAVALSTNSLTDRQTYLLDEASRRFDRVVVMMDNKGGPVGVVDSMRMRQSLFFMASVSAAAVPFGAGDAGELRPHQARDWAAKIVREAVT